MNDNQGKSKAFVEWLCVYQAYRENDTRWHCACRASKHCPASVYTNLLPANRVLETDHNHCPEPVKLEVDRCQTEMSIRAAATNDPPACIYILPKCLLPKCPIKKKFLLAKCLLPKHPLPKCPLPKFLDTDDPGRPCCISWSAS